MTAYVDEASGLKSLPPNPRATGLARLCGYHAVPFFGDVFLGRGFIGGSGSEGAGEGPFRHADMLLQVRLIMSAIAALDYSIAMNSQYRLAH